ncbi:hypothetical protein Nans01_20650 [Nocardiopsis ansamitocini]|uniref:Uncharacterized protein n=1 Tax=Nocardiopsis ansamitocini TaxID=1670832 RepID=A0A9W6P5E4_9ACTN|nr:hypothetical protein Nans01_20650 [Nocardiopsis ansamitocini]
MTIVTLHENLESLRSGACVGDPLGGGAEVALREMRGKDGKKEV